MDVLAWIFLSFKVIIFNYSLKGINIMMRRFEKPTPKRGLIGPLVLRTYIPFMQGRPKRDQRIMKDDVTNLKILLNTCDNFEKLLTSI